MKARHLGGTNLRIPGSAVSAPVRGFRPEIEGLRFFAVFLVVVYHVWLGRVSGGVDVFLLISAFLMTSQFARKIDRDERINLGGHWLHLLKRLLPIAVVVIAATAVMSWLLLPANRWPSIISEGWASLFYFENWSLAANAVDYYASKDSASPFQHFWSLSIQGQVFLIWPLIFLGIAFLRRRLGWDHRRLMLLVFGAIFVVSLAFSVWETETNQAFAYFDLRTRLWEFALGSLLALALPFLGGINRRVRILMGWVGIVAMVACGLVLQVDQQFPGYMALWPTLAAALVIVAGDTSSRFGVDRVLSARPLTFMGGNAYGLYLWHWPILVIFLVWQGRQSVGWFTGSAIIVAAVVLAIVSTRFIERPARRIKWVEVAWYRSVPVVLGCVIIAAVPLVSWQGYLKNQVAEASKNSSADNPGAAALIPGFEFQGNPNAPIQPAPAGIWEQFAVLGSDCEGRWASDVPDIKSVCRAYANSNAPGKSIVVIGDSHSQQWMPALQYAAEENNWQLVSIIKAACPYTVSVPSATADCNAFNQEATDYVTERKPDAVLTVGTVAKPSSSDETLTPGFVEATNNLISQGIQVIAMRDNPRFSFNMAECVISKGSEDPQCNPPRSSLFAAASPFESVSDPPEGLFMLDLTDYLCTPEVCPGEVGNMFVYIDDNHLTMDYSATLGPVFNQRLLAATGWSQDP
ncbi:acyltransferase family protein [Arthrobacter russicus]|uniref:acyltransferase family protein n=1 Tax=Arthrobacter russicus TaxID=172040 RepID=UPI0031E48FDD